SATISSLFSSKQGTLVAFYEGIDPPKLRLSIVTFGENDDRSKLDQGDQHSQTDRLLPIPRLQVDT
ncbi:MAG: hypothetical protein OXS28_11805, partial [Gammaproteobacteria bacterium]|nr:hypothetical protein [Gammaproteobacteria bacterium]